LKMRTSMNKSQTQSAFTTVKTDGVQGHLGEIMLQRFCTVSPKRFLEIVIGYPIELRDIEDLFPTGKQSERIRTAQPSECILLRINKNNIHSLFPKRHMEALDRLKSIKRELNQDSDYLVDQWAAKQRQYEDDESHMGYS
ncbi:hypothetical protein BGZ54_002709, partial [Gamsiella multidivaricata]